MFKLPELHYTKNSLTPFLNEEQVAYHYEKHHKGYIDNLNKFLETDKSLTGKSLVEIILSSTGSVFNNAAQIWNHNFYWLNMVPEGKTTAPSAALTGAVKRDFMGLNNLKAKFIDSGSKIFGSGWIWLCADKTNKLSLISTSNAEVPFNRLLNNGIVPLLVADVWEHAYYLDYRNLRTEYLETFWNYINWEFVSENFESKKIRNF